MRDTCLFVSLWAVFVVFCSSEWKLFWTKYVIIEIDWNVLLSIL